MILGFTIQINDKPTYFVEKIHKSLREIYFGNPALLAFAPEAFELNFYHKCKPKLHTLRDDEKDRWQADIMIDFFINVRTKKMFRFAPRIPVISTQEVLMTYAHSDLIQISIDGRELFDYQERLQFAINDGFDTWEEFFDYFYPKIKAAPKEVYTPKLIHWTNLKY